jgi:hypothetical protein
MRRFSLGHGKRFLSNQEIHVPKLLLPMIGILTMALACGCNSAKSPAAVATDVAAARQQASTEVTDARTDAAKNVDGAAANADGAYDVAVAQADGDHNVAIQQCLALTGEAQKSCKNERTPVMTRRKLTLMLLVFRNFNSHLVVCRLFR